MSFSDYLCLISDQGPGPGAGVSAHLGLINNNYAGVHANVTNSHNRYHYITVSLSAQVFSAQMLALGHLNISYQDKDSSWPCYHINNFTVIIDCAG